MGFPARLRCRNASAPPGVGRARGLRFGAGSGVGVGLKCPHSLCHRHRVNMCVALSAAASGVPRNQFARAHSPPTSCGAYAQLLFFRRMSRDCHENVGFRPGPHPRILAPIWHRFDSPSWAGHPPAWYASQPPQTMHRPQDAARLGSIHRLPGCTQLKHHGTPGAATVLPRSMGFSRRTGGPMGYSARLAVPLTTQEAETPRQWILGKAWCWSRCGMYLDLSGAYGQNGDRFVDSDVPPR